MDKDKIWINSMEWCSKHWGCHQMPERSYFLFGYQFPVCARCTGIIAGYIIAVFMIVAKKQLSLWKAAIMIIPMAIDGGIQYVSSYESTNVRRTITGLLSGIGVIFIIFNCICHFVRLIHYLICRINTSKL